MTSDPRRSHWHPLNVVAVFCPSSDEKYWLELAGVAGVAGEEKTRSRHMLYCLTLSAALPVTSTCHYYLSLLAVTSCCLYHLPVTSTCHFYLSRLAVYFNYRSYLPVISNCFSHTFVIYLSSLPVTSTCFCHPPVISTCLFLLSRCSTCCLTITGLPVIFCCLYGLPVTFCSQ